ncbi:MAG: hypothetical protein FWG72_06525 [Oscillospiraceae bacterium]|nr:hypothetical protein [Oscillospiraceae bacterium]
MSRKKYGIEFDTYAVNPKKPVYKRVWFWLVIVFVGLPVLANIIGENETPSDTGTPPSSSASESPALTPTSNAPSVLETMQKPNPEGITDVDYMLLYDEAITFDSGKWIRTACKAGKVYADREEIRVYDEIIDISSLAAARTYIRIKLSDSEYLDQLKEDDYFVIIGQTSKKSSGVYTIENAFIESVGSSAQDKYISLAEIRHIEIENAEKLRQERLEEARKEYIAECEEVSYNDLSRNPNSYTGKKISVSGDVKQIMGEGSWLYKSGYRFYEDNSSSKEWFIYYNLPEGASRILVNDKLTFFGVFNGIEKFSRAIGSDIYIPTLKAVYIE